MELIQAAEVANLVLIHLSFDELQGCSQGKYENNL